jgi:DNA-binding transcriptional LysR family regulator
MMSSLVEIEAFVAVAEHGSFVAAADALGVSSSYASKLVSRLEQRLGTRLIQRTTRRHSLTPQGQAYLEECQQAFQLLRHAEECIHETASVIRGELRVTAPTELGIGIVSALLDRFAAEQPEVRLTVNYLDRVVDLVAERYDLAVRAGRLPDSSLHARRLGQYCKGLFASPEMASTLADIHHPGGLRGVAAVVYNGQARPESWTLHSPNETAAVIVDPRMNTNNGRAAALAASHGLGLCYLPEFHTVDLVQSGGLVRVLPTWGDDVPVHAVFPSSRQMPLRVRALIDWLAHGFSTPKI